MRKAVFCLLLVLGTPAIARPPRLTLWIVVDALSADLLMRMLPRLSQGFKQLATEGAYFTDARYAYAELATAAGHTTLATGANPRRHGIVGNRVFNRKAGKNETAFADERYRPLEAGADTDCAPSRLTAETLSDRLRFSTYGRSKSVAVSIKARAAIALAGRLGKAWWFNESTGHFLTSNYYAPELAGWVKAFNDLHLPQSYFGRNWELAHPKPTYLGEDNRPFERDLFGLGRTFPHPLTGGKNRAGKEFFGAMVYTPFMNDVLAEFALAAIRGEELGRDGTSDLLQVSFSSTDYVGHLFGPDSWEAQDTMIRLDHAIQQLIAGAMAASGGEANLLVVLTADHGGGPPPEAMQSMGMAADRVSFRSLERALNKELEPFGGRLVQSIEPGRIYLDQGTMAARKVNAVAARRAAAHWLANQPEIALALAVDDLSTAFDPTGYLETLKMGYRPERSGDVLFLVRPFYSLLDEKESATHGTPYEYDSQVPVIFWGKGVKPGLHSERIGVTDVTPTMASLMEISIPALAEGVPLAEVSADQGSKASSLGAPSDVRPSSTSPNR